LTFLKQKIIIPVIIYSIYTINNNYDFGNQDQV
jgi:hypothetical protein